MNKKLTAMISLLLCLSLAVYDAIPALAEEVQQTETQSAAVTVTIATAEDFLAFAENCRLDSYSQNLTVSLEADIDLSGTGFFPVPTFSGTFDGNGHTIFGVNITGDGSVQGLFRYLTQSAVVKDLHVQGQIQPQGSRSIIGGIAGSNAGRIDSCSFTGVISGGDTIGGIAGVNTLTGVITSCNINGSIYGSHFVGGVSGENYGVIRRCVNTAQINTTAQQNSVDISDISIDTLTNSESADTVTDIGGIAGTSSGVIRGCRNEGNVGYQHMGYNIGGIAGTQSGYIVNCENYGQVLGRKEVGGIAGQFEPVYRLEYSVDTLQILQEQLDGLSALTTQASSNAQNGAANVTSQIATLQDQIESAKDAVEQLVPETELPEAELPSTDGELELPEVEIPDIEIPDMELPDDSEDIQIELPDEDSVLAAQNNLSSSLSDMTGTLGSIATATQNTASTLSRDMQAISDQVSAMSQTINQASDNLGGSITDVSDADTPENTTGKVSNCSNYGDVLADWNVGGIVGAISIENDLDPEEDLQITGDSSLNFEGEVRAVVTGCDNHATVTASKQNAGGVIGWQTLGLVKECLNTGALEAEGTEYVGGIAGQSLGYIRMSSAKCELSGGTYVGGIAGLGSTVSDCRSMVRLNSGSEKLGAVLGAAQDWDEAEPTVTGNYYLNTSSDPGAVDGISYSGCAEPLDMDAFLNLEGLSKEFQAVTVTFAYADGTTETVTLAPGEKLDESDIPQIPQEAGCTAYWDGLEAIGGESVYFDTVFTAVYEAFTTTLASEQTNGRLSQVLVQGSFTTNDKLALAEPDSTPVLEDGQTLLEAWCFTVPQSGEAVTARVLLDETYDPSRLTVLTCGADGQWTQTAHSVDGSYIVFPLDSGLQQFALVESAAPIWPWLAAGGAGIAALGLLIWLLRRKKKPATQTAEADTAE